jgi:hypothetical protein
MNQKDDCEKLKNEIKELKEEVNRLRPFSFLTTMEWQPIETAPKNGTEILGWDEEQQEIVFVIWICIQQWDNPYDVFDWVEKGDWANPIKPTHWMPLPKPPTK